MITPSARRAQIWWRAKYIREYEIIKRKETRLSIIKLISSLGLPSPLKLILSLILTILILYLWWRDVHRESSIGHHYNEVQKLIKFAILMFILREVIFFFGFFWSYYWYALNNKIILDNAWPPKVRGLESTLNPYGLSLINCFILLSSGVSVTFAHLGIFEKAHNKVKIGLIITIGFALIFLSVQVFEYSRRNLDIKIFTFGNIFFTITGLHGSHVIVGLVIIFISYHRVKSGYLRDKHHSGIEIAIWYWHFVDVVWLFVYISLYWWVS